VDVALMSGMTSLTAVVLASNRPMLHLLRALNVPSTSARDSDSIEVRLQLAGLELPAELEADADGACMCAQSRRAPLPAHRRSLPAAPLAEMGLGGEGWRIWAGLSCWHSLSWPICLNRSASDSKLP
jgi:hypothetical protein